MWLASGNISKGLEAIKGIVSLRSSFSNFEGATFQNEIESTYASDSWSITPKITSRIAQWWNVSYELTFAQNWLRMKDVDRVSSYKNISQQLSSYFTPSKKWYLQLTGEHYYNEITQDVSKHFLLADAEFTYSFTGGWEFNLLVRNIFNQSVYSYTSYDGLTSMSREYQIRPRNMVASVFFRF
jgi:outer membrane receptor protein involved in Fe transport